MANTPVRQYIGARYVPLFADPSEWNNTKTYEPLTIVLHEGNSYTSRQYVPIGIDITNTEYWAQTGNYNAQVESYRQEVQRLSDDVTKLRTEMIPTYQTATEMAANTYAENTIIRTLGHDNINDNGGALYIIANTQSFGSVQMANDLYANVIIMDETTPEQFGITADWTETFNTLTNNITQTHKITLTPNKTYTCTAPVNIKWFHESGNTLEGNNAIIEAQQGITINEPSSGHEFIGGTYRNLTINTNNISVIALNVQYCIKGTFENITIKGTFNTGLKFTDGYESTFNNIRIINNGNANTGIDIAGGDSVFTNLFGRNCQTFLHIGKAGNLINNIHAWIAPNDYATLWDNSRMIDVDVPGTTNFTTITGIYCDSYKYFLYLSRDFQGVYINNIYNYVNTSTMPPSTDTYLVGNPDNRNTSRILISKGKITTVKNITPHLTDNDTFNGICDILLTDQTALSGNKQQTIAQITPSNGNIEIVESDIREDQYNNVNIYMKLHIKQGSTSIYSNIDLGSTPNIINSTITHTIPALCCKQQNFYSSVTPAAVFISGTDTFSTFKLVNPYNTQDEFWVIIDTTLTARNHNITQVNA